MSGFLYLSHIKAALMAMNVMNIVKFVRFATNSISPIKTNNIAINPTTAIATHGVLLPLWTFPRCIGSDLSLPIPKAVHHTIVSMKSVV